MRKLSKAQLATIKRRVYSSNYRSAKQFGLDGDITSEEVLELFERQPNCAYCGRKLTPSTLSLDHVKPLSRDGLNEIENIVLSCRRDNRYKRAQSAEEYKNFLRVLEANKLTSFFFSNYRPQSHRRRY